MQASRHNVEAYRLPTIRIPSRITMKMKISPKKVEMGAKSTEKLNSFFMSTPRIGATFGGAVGDAVGGAVGEASGGVVGEALEASVGETLEAAVGDPLEDVVGEALGSVVGDAIGVAVGGMLGGGSGGTLGTIKNQYTNPKIKSKHVSA